MSKSLRMPLHAGLLLALAAAAARGETSPRHLLLLGGADRSPAAMGRFVAWAGGKDARILVVPYASGIPADYGGAMIEELRRLGAGRADLAVSTAALAQSGPAAFLDQLSSATGVFLTGGDQVRLMDVLNRHGLAGVLRARYRAGMPVAGTSAGTAVMSDPMLTGDGDFAVIDGAKVKTAPGLGLLSGPFIVDQHFIKRQRENRLFGVILQYPDRLGVGVDESSALAVTDEREAEVLDEGGVMVVRASKPGEETLTVEILRAGQKYDLKERRRK